MGMGPEVAYLMKDNSDFTRARSVLKTRQNDHLGPLMTGTRSHSLIRGTSRSNKPNYQLDSMRTNNDPF